MRHIIDEEWDRRVGSGYVVGTRCALYDCSCTNNNMECDQSQTYYYIYLYIVKPLQPLTRNLFLKKKKKKLENQTLCVQALHRVNNLIFRDILCVRLDTIYFAEN